MAEDQNTPAAVTDAAAAAPAAESTTPEQQAEQRNARKTRVGYVTSDKMAKTITVSVERRIQHPLYGKYLKRHKKYTAHDETNECNVGDLVRIMETRPLSKKKRWRLVEVLEKAK